MQDVLDLWNSNLSIEDICQLYFLEADLYVDKEDGMATSSD